MTTNEHDANASAIAIEIGDVFTVIEAFAAKKSVALDAKFEAISFKKIGKNDFVVAKIVDSESDTLINVHASNIAAKIESAAKIVRKSAHADCAHAVTKAARAVCRRERKSASE